MKTPVRIESELMAEVHNRMHDAPVLGEAGSSNPQEDDSGQGGAANEGFSQGFSLNWALK